jgi:hypothetical protein
MKRVLNVVREVLIVVAIILLGTGMAALIVLHVVTTSGLAVYPFQR